MTEPEAERTTRPKRRSSRFADDGKTNLEAQYDAQKLAFGPLMFQAARVLRDTGALECIKASGRSGITAEELEERVDSLSIYAARLLLEAALAAEMVALENERYVLTKVGFLVLSDKMTTVNIDFVHDVCYRAFFHFDETIRTGKPAGLKEFGPWDTVYEGLTQLPEHVQRSWFAFDHYYSDSVFETVLPTVFANNPKTILDVGCNTGKWAMQCCEHDADVRVTVLDHPGQLARALENAVDRGFADRVTGQAIDFLDPDAPLPHGFDVVWMSQFLDCFGEDEIISILSRALPALAPDGKLFILETYWDRQRYEAARYSVINTSLYFAAVANGNSKMYHSDRMKHCIATAGLKVEEETDDIGMSHTLFRCGPA
jgi:SAM-dependent methyltransferase